MVLRHQRLHAVLGERTAVNMVMCVFVSRITVLGTRKYRKEEQSSWYGIVGSCVQSGNATLGHTFEKKLNKTVLFLFFFLYK